MNRRTMCSPELLPGFRFHPTDQELIIHYLRKKVSSSNLEVVIIADVDIYKFNPWELPGKTLFGESEWFFFSPRDRKYPNGARPNRAAGSGYWKATGTDKPILTSNGSQCLGVKKALVFYKGRPPKGIKTSWLMLEYRLLDDTHHQHMLRGSMRLDDWVLCRVRQKSKTRPQNGDDHCRNFSSFSPFTSLRCLQGQEIFKKGNTLKDYYYDLQPCLMAPAESEEAAEQGQVEFQEVSPEYTISGSDSSSHPTMVSTVKEKLEYIKKILSIGALEELVPTTPKKRLHVSSSNNAENAYIFDELPSPPKKRLHIFSSNKAENECIFEVSSPTLSASSQQSFQGS
ncbi:hypothetical protein Peur_061453 [Populus x canadensis]